MGSPCKSCPKVVFGIQTKTYLSGARSKFEEHRKRRLTPKLGEQRSNLTETLPLQNKVGRSIRCEVGPRAKEMHYNLNLSWSQLAVLQQANHSRLGSAAGKGMMSPSLKAVTVPCPKS